LLPDISVTTGGSNKLLKSKSINTLEDAFEFEVLSDLLNEDGIKFEDRSILLAKLEILRALFET
jgi:hypothetical protein